MTKALLFNTKVAQELPGQYMKLTLALTKEGWNLDKLAAYMDKNRSNDVWIYFNIPEEILKVYLRLTRSFKRKYKTEIYLSGCMQEDAQKRNFGYSIRYTDVVRDNEIPLETMQQPVWVVAFKLAPEMRKLGVQVINRA